VPGHEMRKSALRRYVVFRIKAMEFLDLNALRNSLKANQISPAPQIRPPQFMADSVRTVVLSWFALFVDKNGLDVTKLWIELFPKHAARVREAWTRMEPVWQTIREFRDCAGFHADKPKKFFAARYKIRAEDQRLDAALKEFAELLKFFLKAEAQELPDLETALDALLDDLEKEHGAIYKREQFKAYLMIRETPKK
jgi:hypothetical protein